MLRLRVSAGARGLTLCLLVLAVGVPLDARLHDLVFRYVDSHEVRLTANGFTLLGTAWAATGLLGGLALVAHRAGDVALLRASVGGLGGLAIASLASQVVKQVACRGRPKLLDGWGVDPVGPSTGGAGAFFHWPCLVDSRYHSFPSGHATTAFAVAAALTRAVPTRRRIWLVVAGGVAASRVLLNAHFLSDVLAGAFLGWWGGHLGERLADRLASALAIRRSKTETSRGLEQRPSGPAPSARVPGRNSASEGAVEAPSDKLATPGRVPAATSPGPGPPGP